MEFQTGSLVRVRNRDWIVQPSGDSDLLLLKPLGGTDDEVTGIYLPAKFPSDKIESSKFPLPEAGDIGDIDSAKILYNAARLSFRNGGGPFRSLAKLSFRPRSYQIVPLIMALRIGLVRLLIADDVGIGKTIEALMIAKEIIERKEIERFAVICPPHLCDQWQKEIKDKFGIDAVIIRSNTQGKLDREIKTVRDISVYDYYKYQVISIDYIKSDQRRQVFIQQCPELVIVDEAHTAVKPAGASRSQQQRYELLYELSLKKDQNIVLMTATPHSGKQEEFQSLLGLLKPEFESLEISAADKSTRKKISEHFVQRKRADVTKWLDENTLFPERETEELGFAFSGKYLEVFNEVLDLAHKLTSGTGEGKRYNYWAALALLRGVMSSPAAGIEMLRNKVQKNTDDEEGYGEANPVLEDEFNEDADYTRADLLGNCDLNSSEKSKLNHISKNLETLKGGANDVKINAATEVVLKWLKEGFNPVVFCKYVATAKYAGEVLSEKIREVYRHADVQVITGEDPDDLRKQRIEGISVENKRVLVSTDCLSEGFNLQDKFTAVLHYDLPWNPNKLEQREGRVDRFGQTSNIVKVALLYGKNNPVDGVVLDVIIKKVRQIRRDIFISIPFPEDSKSIMDAVLHAVLLNGKYGKTSDQMTFNFENDREVEKFKLEVSNELDVAAKREVASRNIFAQNAIRPNEIEEDLKFTDESIGNPNDVREFVEGALKRLGVQIDKFKSGYRLFTQNMPETLKSVFGDISELKISFESPTPEGYVYIGRNHILVEQLCSHVLSNAIRQNMKYGAARAAVIKTRKVEEKTTLLLFRVRNVIAEEKKNNQLVAEEMIITGYSGKPFTYKDFLSMEESTELLFNSQPSANMTSQSQAEFLRHELGKISELQNEFDKIAFERCELLVEAHERFRKAVGGRKFRTVEPVLPMDLMGIYILLPC